MCLWKQNWSKLYDRSIYFICFLLSRFHINIDSYYINAYIHEWVEWDDWNGQREADGIAAREDKKKPIEYLWLATPYGISICTFTNNYHYIHRHGTYFTWIKTEKYIAWLRTSNNDRRKKKESEKKRVDAILFLFFSVAIEPQFISLHIWICFFLEYVYKWVKNV